MTLVRAAVAVAVVVAAAPAGAQALSAGPAAKSTRTQVHGGYFNVVAFVPTGIPQPTGRPDVYRTEFTGGSEWNGDFTGQTVVTGVAEVNTRTGAVSGTFTDTLHGTYTPDRRTGTLTVSGTFAVDENGTFVASGQIVTGTCGFAGSRGSMEFFGHGLNGGYRGTWLHREEHPHTGVCVV